jgi:lactate permease
MAGRQTPFVALIVPMLLVFIVDGRRGVKQAWPVALVAGAAFAVSQFVTSNYLAVELTDVVAAVVTVAAVLVMLRFWKPKETIGMAGRAESGAEEAVPANIRQGAVAARAGTTAVSRTSGAAASGPAAAGNASDGSTAPTDNTRPEPRHIWMAIAPYLIIITVFSIAQIPAVKSWLNQVGTVAFHWPGLDISDSAGKPVAATKFKLDHLKATGTLLLFSGLITMALYRITAGQGWRIYRETLVQLRWTIVTVTSVLALSFVMNLSGQTTTLGFALASAGSFFAVLSPLIGWIGVALTGSDTSSNSLFGQMQATAAQQTGLSPVLMAASNSSAGVMGKMLSLQNLAVASAAVGLDGSEGTLFRKLIGWSVGLLALITVLILLQSTPVLGWMVP